MDDNLTFCQLKEREVINTCDGKRLGRVIDLIFTPKGTITGFIVPGDKKFFRSMSCDNIFIPWKHICRIGEDTILVELSDKADKD